MRSSDMRVRIPMSRGTDSLNVATAAALAFYERARLASDRGVRPGAEIRQVAAVDAAVCGRICHDAFAAIANLHRIPDSSVWSPQSRRPCRTTWSAPPKGLASRAADRQGVTRRRSRRVGQMSADYRVDR